MTLRLTFVPESRRYWYGIEGEDAEAILDAWNALPAWSIFDPANFRQRIVDIEGAEKYLPGGMPAADEEILDAVVKCAGPDGLKLERGPGLTREQQREFDAGPPVRPDGTQTQAQAETFAVSSFRYICQLDGLYPIPSEADVRAAIAQRRSQ